MCALCSFLLNNTLLIYYLFEALQSCVQATRALGQHSCLAALLPCLHHVERGSPNCELDGQFDIPVTGRGITQEMTTAWHLCPYARERERERETETETETEKEKEKEEEEEEEREREREGTRVEGGRG